ncbi:MAG: hypothetical protein ACQEQV_05065 [Fibrobacterota bacterium]
MFHNKIGIATSIFKEKDFDPLETVRYITDRGLTTVQLYMDSALEKDMDALNNLRELCTEKKLHVLCHSPYYLNREVINDGRHIASLNRVFPRNQKKEVVFHFDEETTVETALSVIRMLNKNSITVCLENYYKFTDRDSLVTNINRFNLLINRAAEQNLDCIPLIDIPRLFIAGFEEFNSLFLTELLLNNITYSNRSVILHLIDFTDRRQRREDWCAIGSGLMPYETLFDIMKRYRLQVRYAVLEYEATDPVPDSLSGLTELLARLD